MTIMEKVKDWLTSHLGQDGGTGSGVRGEAEGDGVVKELSPSPEVQRNLLETNQLIRWARERRRLAEEVLDESLEARLDLQSGGRYRERDVRGDDDKRY